MGGGESAGDASVFDEPLGSVRAREASNELAVFENEPIMLGVLGRGVESQFEAWMMAGNGGFLSVRSVQDADDSGSLIRPVRTEVLGCLRTTTR